MKSHRVVAALVLAALAACGTQSTSGTPAPAPASSADASTSTGGPGAPEGGSTDASTPGADGGSPSDPFAPQPDESAGLTNVSSDLKAVLENGALAGACDSYYDAGQTDPKTKLLCGKWQFFYETFGTSGLPAALVQFLATNFPAELGLGFSKLGMIPDPSSTTNMPLGIAPTAPYNGTIPEVAFTCASCHFGQLPDGRYAVGAPHLGYDYGRHILDITLVAGIAMGMSDAGAHDPDALAKVQPVLDAITANPSLKTQLSFTLLPLISLPQPAMTKQIEHDYATWPTGAMDFLIAPLPVDDNVHIVGKMIGLWGIPRPAEVTATGMSGELLGWTGDTAGLDQFLRGFALFGKGTVPTDAQMSPLLEYIYSLRAPSNPSPPDPAQVTAGAALFSSKGCASCHDGPRGSGKRAYTFSEIGTDSTLQYWADPTLSGNICCGMPVPPGGMTHGVKSPRLVGMWALDRFLHNGTLSTLDQLFCMGDGGDGGLEGGRPPVGTEPLRTDGHTFGCDLTSDEKHALEAYLLAH